MKISAADVGKLRKMTGAGMMDSKKALVEAEGDFEKAVEVLRKKGQKVASKRADRDSSEGAVIAKVNEDAKKGVVISLNCETDFVAKNDEFVKLATEMAEKALTFSSKEEFLASNFGELSVQEKLIEKTGVIGEKIEVGNFEILTADFVGSYIHAGNKIATLVGLNRSIDNPTVAKDVAMQVAAMNPLALDEDGIDQSIIDKEVEIAKVQLRQEGKPEEMLDKISKGKIKKFLKENTLVNQEFIKDNKISIKEYVKKEGGGAEVISYKRVSLS